jgi:DNA/RNA-binding domain of Phe-tRNA-synthetase-like protein
MQDDTPAAPLPAAARVVERRAVLHFRKDVSVTWLEDASVDPAVFALRPDYRALLVVAEGLVGGPPDAASESLLVRAETAGVTIEHPHLEAWRECFREFGANPRKTRPSADALVRRAATGLPRIDRITDTYNALSVLHAIPTGGEDLDGYDGRLRLARADGTEPFDTITDGEPVLEHPLPGEVVWRDDAGVTCRNWNWRQCVRTRLSPQTTRAVFIFDALAPVTDDELLAIGEDLLDALRPASSEIRLLRA